ncbi:MAG: nucleoside monophosphate kinase [Planctomycetes bacterium]|nr:nucleoside monophosphate kinase [Planctomycetota bacterium]
MSGHPSRDGWYAAGEVDCFPVPPPRERPSRLVLLGAPGAGKGTQARLLCESLRACHLSTGELFRAARDQCASSPAMRAAIEAMNRGELVPEELVIAMVRERANCLRCHGGFVLDGFPRNQTQAIALDEILAELHIAIEAVVYLELPQEELELPLEEIVARLSGRRTCVDCRAVFDLAANPPTRSGVCDYCGERLVQRTDDQPEAIRVRMKVFEAETLSLVEFYERLGKLVRISASGTPEQIRDRVLQGLDRNVSEVAT